IGFSGGPSNNYPWWLDGLNTLVAISPYFYKILDNRYNILWQVMAFTSNTILQMVLHMQMVEIARME
ncbi:MAG: hypothetical protein WCK53_09385, partial [Methanomicrobiales archaeon]